jgi:hypothetical protein
MSGEGMGGSWPGEGYFSMSLKLSLILACLTMIVIKNRARANRKIQAAIPSFF